MVAKGKNKVRQSTIGVNHPLPPLPQIPSVVLLGSEIRRGFVEMCDENFQQALHQFHRHLSNQAIYPQPEPLTSEETETAFEFLESGKGPYFEVLSGKFWRWGNETESPLRRFLELAQLHPITVVRVLAWTGYSFSSRHYSWLPIQFAPNYLELLRHYWKRHDVGFALGFRELGTVFQAAGIDPQIIGRTCLSGWSILGLTFRLEPEATWPYFVDHEDLLEEALEMRPKVLFDEAFAWKYFRIPRRQAAFEILAMFPQLPERLLDYCWQVALGSAKSERPLAQKALAKVPDKTARIIAELDNGKQEVRGAAADWLAQIGHAQAIPALKVALHKEKHDFAKGALMGALERLGVPVDEFLDRDGLARDAERGLKKGIPKVISWFPVDQLPVVHWQDTGKRVPHRVLTWFLVQANKLKNPEPTPLLRRYASYFRPEEAEQLGMVVLTAWIAQDTKPPSQAEAAQNAQKQFNQWGSLLGLSYQQFLVNCLRQPSGSAIKEKGILALAAACCGTRAAQVVGDYLRTWYGNRAAQCKALVQMLAWIENPAAIGLLLSTAKRFRTAGIRKEAEKQVNHLAERLDWTIDELSDHSISNCGLDAKGEFVLDYGERRFTARLDDDLGFVLAGTDNKVISTLPEPRKSEDADKVKQAKKRFADAKKELKVVVRQQQERLYEAMCTERGWKFADWDGYLHRHPIVGRLCGRLVWAVYREENAITTFRPLADGSLSDFEDRSVEVAADSIVRLAHGTTVLIGTGERWKAHFADYEVVPLFDQFAAPDLQLTEDMKDKAQISEFLGHLIEAFKLRGRATKRGYMRVNSEDGGWFYRYHKRFPSVGIEAVLEFSGNSLREENRLVALQYLHFARSPVAGNDSGPWAGEAGLEPARMALGQVPSVLLNECWTDLRTIAADGKGFDPDWEKKVQP